jgi:hypothetical protein
MMQSLRNRIGFDNSRREERTMFRSFGRKSLIVLTLILGLVLGSTMGPLPAMAGGTGGESYSNCGTGAPSGSSYMSYSESPEFTSNFVSTADENNCSTWMQVEDITKTVKGSVVTYTAKAGVTLSYASVYVVNPFDSRQTGSLSVPLKSGTTVFSYNTDNLPVFIYRSPKKSGKSQSVRYVRKVTSVYISGADANYPAPPMYDGCGSYGGGGVCLGVCFCRSCLGGPPPPPPPPPPLQPFHPSGCFLFNFN